MEEKVLHLVLKKKWYDMIEQGIKKEEYRSFSDYWKKRLINETNIYGPYFELDFKHFTHVVFHLGYTNTTMKFKIAGFDFRTGVEKWGAEPHISYIVIKLGERIKL